MNRPSHRLVFASIIMAWCASTAPALTPTAAPTTAPTQTENAVETKAAVAAAAPPSAPASRTRYARRLVTIPLDRAAPDWMQLSRHLDESAARLAPQVLNLQPDQASDALQYRGEFSNDRADLVITVKLPDDAQARPAAREFADQLVSDLQAFVKDARENRAKEEVNPPKEELAAAREGYDKAVKGIKEFQFKLRDSTGRLDVSPQHIAESAARLDQERLRLEIDQAAKNARREALTAAVADASKRMAEKVKQDQVAAELAKVVASRERAVERMQKLAESGQVSREEIDRASEALADARARYLERQQQAAEQAGGDVLSGWNRELLGLTVDEHELGARLEQVQTRLKSMRALVDSMEDLRRMQEELERSRAALADAQQRLKRTMDHLKQIEQTQRLLIREADDRRESPSTNKEQTLRDRAQRDAEREEAATARMRDQAARDAEKQEKDKQKQKDEKLKQEKDGATNRNEASTLRPPTTRESDLHKPRIQRGDSQ
jgi:hypothetical protein